MTHRNLLGRPCDPRSWRRLAAPPSARAGGGACRPMSVQMHVRRRPHAHCGGRPGVVTLSNRYPVTGETGARHASSSGATNAGAYTGGSAERGPWSPASRTVTPTPSPIPCWPRAARARAGSPPAAVGSSPRSPSPLLRDRPVRCAGDPTVTRSVGYGDRYHPDGGTAVTPPEHDNRSPTRRYSGRCTTTARSLLLRLCLLPAALTDLAPPDFPTVRRGYAPAAVDAHVELLAESLTALRAALTDSERRRAMAEQHAVAVEEEIRVVRSGVSPTDAGFGARAERMLRLAETEAEQIRATAHRTAAEVTERALSEAERHRHDVRQQLIAESARAEEQAARRAAELQGPREPPATSAWSGHRAEADAVRTAAERAALAHRQSAEADVGGAPPPHGRRARPRPRAGRARAGEAPRAAGRARAPSSPASRRRSGPNCPRIAPDGRPSPRPTRRAEAPPVEGPQTGPKREPSGGAADDTTTPYRFATAGR